MRSIRAVTRTILEQARHDEGLVFMVTITHPNLDRDVHLVTDDVDWQFEGKLWTSSWFELTLLTDTDRPPTTSFSYPNIDPQRSRMLEQVKEPAEVFFDVYSTDIVDKSTEPRALKSGITPVSSYPAKHLSLTNVQVTPARVSGTLENFDPRREGFPSFRVTEEMFGGPFYQ